MSFIHHNINSKTMNATYTCRVNSTLGSQNISIFVTSDNDNEPEETDTIAIQSVTSVAAKHSLDIPVIPIATASAGALLVLLGIIFIVCIISLR